MCLAYPGTIKKVSGRTATVCYPHETRQVLVGDLQPKVGDKILVQMGIIIKILSPKEYSEVSSAWSSLSQSYSS